MGGQTGWVLFAFGVTSILSVLVVSRHIDRHLRRLTVGSTLVFAISVLILAAVSGMPVLVYIAAAAWGFAFGSSPSLFIGAAINATEEAADVAQSIVITVFSASIAAGGLIGGLLIADLGTTSITWASLVLLIASAATGPSAELIRYTRGSTRIARTCTPCVTPMLSATRGSAHRPRTTGCLACTQGNSSASPKEASATGCSYAPFREPHFETSAPREGA